ncbi:MAG: cation transporter [Oligoflexia bacterium]|nr:cation transporter [Oligoflexia bacterium]
MNPESDKSEKLEQSNKLKKSAAVVSIISNITLIILKLVIGIIMNSVSVLSEAIHSAIDLLAAVIAYFSIKEASKPADEIHPYGHGKFENVSGMIEAILIFLAAIYIIHESIAKIISKEVIKEAELGIIVMFISVIVNFFVSRYLFIVAKKTDSMALEADAWHLRTDVYTSLGIFVGLILIKITGNHLLDPIVAIIVAAWLIIISFKLIFASLKDITDSKLSDDEEKIIIDILKNNSDLFIEYHKLRSRKAGSERFVDLHLVVPRHWNTEKTHAISHMLEHKIAESLSGTQLIIHIEPCKKKSKKCIQKFNCTECTL